MTALVLGLLVNSAKTAFDGQSRALTEMSAKVILLDRALSHYGPETKEARDLLKSLVSRLIEQTWPKDQRSRAMSEPSAPGSEILYDKIQELVPANDMQRVTVNRALNLAIDIGQMRWLIVEQGYSCGCFLIDHYIYEFWAARQAKWNASRNVFSGSLVRIRSAVLDFGDVYTFWRLHSDIQCALARGACLFGSVAARLRRRRRLPWKENDREVYKDFRRIPIALSLSGFQRSCAGSPLATPARRRWDHAGQLPATGG